MRWLCATGLSLLAALGCAPEPAREADAPRAVAIEEAPPAEVSRGEPAPEPADSAPVGAPGEGASGATSGPVFVDDTMTPPQALSQVAPVYPPEALIQKLETVVVVKYVVNVQGQVENIRVVRGDPLFHQAVIQAVAQWRFKPATLQGGLPVAVHRVAKIPFRIR